MELGILKPDNVWDAYGLTVKDYFITSHNVNNISMPPLMKGTPVGVTIHNTDDINEAANTTDPEQYTRATLNVNQYGASRMGSVRVHFYVDDDEAWQNLPFTYQSWHCGQKGKAETSKAAVGNAQTISIECIMKSVKDSKAEDNCAKLAAYILNKYNLTIDRLFTHNYWCNVRNGRTGTTDELNTTFDGYKGCPIFIRPHWYEFKTVVYNYMRQFKTATSAKYLVVKQFGAYNDQANAKELLQKLKEADKDGYYKIMKVVT